MLAWVRDRKVKGFAYLPLVKKFAINIVPGSDKNLVHPIKKYCFRESSIQTMGVMLSAMIISFLKYCFQKN